MHKIVTLPAVAPRVETGARVRYHGSLVGHHGIAVVQGRCDCDECYETADFARLTGGRTPAPRFELLPLMGSGMLLHVRRESFTVEGQA